MPLGAPLVTLTEASVSFGERTVLDRLSLEVSPSDSFALMGPSGSGKSTLLGVIAGMQRLNGGTCESSPDLSVTWIFQSAPLFLARTVRDNVALGAAWSGVQDDTASVDVDEAITRVGLQDLSAKPARTLSGGERQRVAIARGICSANTLMLADEPTAALDSDNRDLVGKALAAAALDTAVICATHDPVLASYFGTTLHLRNGAIE